MIIGYAATALVTPLYSYVVHPMQVLVFRFLERVGKGIRTAPRDSLVAASSPKNETGKSFGFHKAMDNSGAIIGPLIAAAVLFFYPKTIRIFNIKPSFGLRQFRQLLVYLF